MPDPYAVFRASPNKQKTLLALWPDLHASLAGTDKPAAPRSYTCVLDPCATMAGGDRPAGVARLTRWGSPACAMHIGRHADRSGGWPLDLKDHRP